MIIKDLYRITRKDGGTDITPNKPLAGEYTKLYRLIAEENKILTDGINNYICIDTDDINAFTEIEEVE